MHERQQEEEEDDIYHIFHNYPFTNGRENALLGKDEYDYRSTEEDVHRIDKRNNKSQIVSVRRVSRHRKGANISRSSQPSSNNDLKGRRPYSMSCLVAPNLTNPYHHSIDPIYQNLNNCSPFREDDECYDSVPNGAYSNIFYVSTWSYCHYLNHNFSI